MSEGAEDDEDGGERQGYEEPVVYVVVGLYWSPNDYKLGYMDWWHNQCFCLISGCSNFIII